MEHWVSEEVGVLSLPFGTPYNFAHTFARLFVMKANSLFDELDTRSCLAKVHHYNL